MDSSTSERPKKVFFVIDYLYGLSGGTEGQLHALIEGLIVRGYEPYLAVLRATTFTASGTPFICPVSNLDVQKVFSPRTLVGMMKLMRRLRREGIRHVHVFFNDSAVLVPLFAKSAGCKVIVSRRDMGFWYTPVRLMLLRVANRFVDCVIANSVAVAEHARRCEWVPRKSMVVIYNGYSRRHAVNNESTSIRDRYRIGKNDRIIGIVANLTAVKRHKDLIAAVAIVRVRQPDAHLVIVGDGPLKQMLQDLTAKLRIQQWVHFVGSLDNVIPIVEQFDIGVLCSESEGLSNALIEYLACGIPVICTRAGGNGELVSDGENGFLVEVGDVATLAKRIASLLDDRSLARVLGDRGRETVEALTVDRMVSAHIATYASLGL